MSTTPIVPSAVEGRTPSMATVLGHVPEMAAHWSRLYGRFWQSPVVPAALKELVRLRNAKVTDCAL